MGSHQDETRPKAETDSSTFTTVLVVDDEEPMRHMLGLLLRREGYTVLTADCGEAALETLAEQDVDLVLSDVRMPGMGGLELVERTKRVAPRATVIVMSAFGSVDLAIDAMKRGAYDYISKPFKSDEVLLALRKAEERERLRRDNRRLRREYEKLVAQADRLGDMLIHSTGMQSIAQTVKRVAAFKTTVLVLGESGVGKELVSRAIHRASGRAQGPFVPVNCGAIPEALLESELFGHVKGAFTGAHCDKPGLFQQANGGTIFLDEIGELPVALQVKLLRVLQESEVRPVGAVEATALDVRVVAATSRHLDHMVESGAFRQDLYYRINVMSISIPPLRERREEILPLAQLFVERINKRLGTRIVGLGEEVLDVLTDYDWPGNVRELENVMEHAMVMAEGDLLEIGGLPDRVRYPQATSEGGESIRVVLPGASLSVKLAQRKLECELILRALQQTAGNRTHAARLLDLSPRALLYKIKDYGLS